MTDIIDGETGELVTYEPPAPVTLWGTTDPTVALQKQTAVATTLAKVIGDRNLYVVVGKKAHVLVEGWTLLGSLLGVFAVIEWTKKLDDPEGWEARAEARTIDGHVVGAAEAQCTRLENMWSFHPISPKTGKELQPRDDFALRAMAQTRAVSRAMRAPLGFVVKLAGYEPTAAEEMLDVKVENEGPNPSATGADTKLATEPQLKRLFALCSALDKKGVAPPSEEKWEDYVKVYCRDTWGLESRRQLTRGQVQFLFEHLEGGVPF